MIHPHAPCKFWSKSYGVVPDAMTSFPFNDFILCKDLLQWPP